MKIIQLDNINNLPDLNWFMYQNLTPVEAAKKYHEKHKAPVKVVYAVTFPGGRVDCFIPWEGER